MLCEALDEDTMSKTEDDTELKLNLYDPMQAWNLDPEHGHQIQGEKGCEAQDWEWQP